jgi:hypothetical protein
MERRRRIIDLFYRWTFRFRNVLISKLTCHNNFLLLNLLDNIKKNKYEFSINKKISFNDMISVNIDNYKFLIKMYFVKNKFSQSYYIINSQLILFGTVIKDMKSKINPIIFDHYAIYKEYINNGYCFDLVKSNKLVIYKNVYSK